MVPNLVILFYLFNKTMKMVFNTVQHKGVCEKDTKEKGRSK